MFGHRYGLFFLLTTTTTPPPPLLLYKTGGTAHVEVRVFGIDVFLG
jgi:hypothetical protein